ncbi:MAG: ubiquinol-cytochrome C chaperone family protein [Parvularculaceae bacterium]
MLSLFRKAPHKIQAESLYSAVVDASRLAIFYREGGAPDTPEGRFEMLSLHMFLTLRRLRAENGGAKVLADAVQKEFFDNLENSLREMGVGDLVVGKKLRNMAEAFYGRAKAYQDGVGASDGAGDGAGDDAVLANAISRNIFSVPMAPTAREFSQYVKLAGPALDKIALENLANAGPDALAAVAADTITGAGERHV